jgi:hypothetical protein
MCHPTSLLNRKILYPVAVNRNPFPPCLAEHSLSWEENKRSYQSKRADARRPSISSGSTGLVRW